MISRPCCCGGRLSVPKDRALAMADYVQTTTKKGLRSFLGSISYYRKFVKNISDLTAVLTPSKVLWSEDMVRVFHELKSSLVNLCV